jgi:hypothetical protein
MLAIKINIITDLRIKLISDADFDGSGSTRAGWVLFSEISGSHEGEDED